jgi:phage shock protein B
MAEFMYTIGVWGLNLVELIIVMLLGIPLLAIIGGTLVALLGVVRGGGSREDRGGPAEETELIQEIHDGLVRMEERVEALETILLDRERDKTKGARQ